MNEESIYDCEPFQYENPSEWYTSYKHDAAQGMREVRKRLQEHREALIAAETKPPLNEWEEDTEIVEEYPPGVQVALNAIERAVLKGISPTNRSLYLPGLAAGPDMAFMKRRGWIDGWTHNNGETWMHITHSAIDEIQQEKGLG